MERVQLRMTRSDGSTVSVLLDTDTPRIFLPPFYYYEYNDYESTETLPLLEALGLTAWPAETEDMNCNPWLTELMEEFVPLPTAPVSAADGVFPLVEDVVSLVQALVQQGLPHPAGKAFHPVIGLLVRVVDALRRAEVLQKPHGIHARGACLHVRLLRVPLEAAG